MTTAKRKVGGQVSEDDTLRMPSHDLDAEYALISGWLMADDLTLLRRSQVDDGVFYDGTNRAISALVRSCVEQGLFPEGSILLRRAAMAHDPATVEKIRDRLAFVINVGTSPAMGAHYAEVLTRLAAKRRAEIWMRRMLGGEVGEDALPDELERAAKELRGGMRRGDIDGPMGEIVGSAVARACTPYDPKASGDLSWQIGPLDSKGVRIRRGDFPVLAARPGCGKTTFARQWAFKTAQYRNRIVVYCSLEQEPEDNAYDALLAQAGVADPKGGILSEADRRAISEAAEFCRGVPLYFPRRVPSRLNDLVDWMHAVAVRHDPIAFVVDYIGLVQARGDSAYERATMTSSRLRMVARDTTIPVVAVSQLSRASVRDNREPMLEDLRDSGQIEQDATQVMFLHYPYRTAPPQQQRMMDPGSVTLLLPKNRWGVANLRVPLRAEWARHRILVDHDAARAGGGVSGVAPQDGDS